MQYLCCSSLFYTVIGIVTQEHITATVHPNFNYNFSVMNN